MKVYALIQGQEVFMVDLTDRDVKVGREVSPEDILLDVTSVSREHGVFKLISGRWFYADLGSANGSYASGRRLAEGEYFEVTPDVTLAVSNVMLRFKDDVPSEEEIEQVAEKDRKSDAHVKSKQTYVFSPDVLEELRATTFEGAGAARPAYRGRKLESEEDSGIFGKSGMVFLMFVLFFLVCVFGILFFVLFL